MTGDATDEGRSVPPDIELVDLGASDLDAIMEVEHRAFDATMRASEATVRHRLALGHHVVGAAIGGRLVGTVGFSETCSPGPGFDRLPPTFEEYSAQPVPEGADTICIYSLGIAPEGRGIRPARALIDAAFDHGRRQGFAEVVADGPLPSLAGNEQVRARPEVRAMVDRYLATGRLPTDDEFLKDPVLALYRRLTGCRFVALLGDFLPEDTASEGWRVLLHRYLP